MRRLVLFFLTTCVAFTALVVPAISCELPSRIDFEFPPSDQAETISSQLKKTTLYFVPYSQEDGLTQYRAWTMNEKCTVISVPVEHTSLNNAPKENGILCAALSASEGDVQCQIENERNLDYHYESGGLKADSKPLVKKRAGKVYIPGRTITTGIRR